MTHIINPTGPATYQPAIFGLGRLTYGTNGEDHFINLRWGDLVFGGDGDDVFDFSSNIGSLHAGSVARVYDDDNAVYYYGPRANGRDPRNADHSAPHVPGAHIEDAGSSLVNGAAGVWATMGNGADTFIFHGPGDRSNPGVFFGFDPSEGDRIGLDHDLGLGVRNIRFYPDEHLDAQGRLTATLLSIDLKAASGNPASPNAYMQVAFDDDRRGTWHPTHITDTDRNGSLADNVTAFVDQAHDGRGADWILP